MTSKKASKQAAAQMAAPKSDSVSPVGAAEGESPQCPKCFSRDHVQMPPAGAADLSKAQRLDMGPDFVSEPFCNRCMNYLSNLQRQVWEDRPENLPHVTRRQREAQAAWQAKKGGAA